MLGSIDLLQTITSANNAAKHMDKRKKNTSIDVRDISLNLQLVGLGIQTLGEKAFMKAGKRIITPSESGYLSEH